MSDTSIKQEITQQMTPKKATSLLQELKGYNEHQLRSLLVNQLTKQKLGLQWESNAIERDAALNANIVLPRLVPDLEHRPEGVTEHGNLIIEGDNFDSLHLLKMEELVDLDNMQTVLDKLASTRPFAH